MRELGPFEVEGHLRVGKRAAQTVDLVVVLGEMAALIGREAEAAGARVIFTNSREDWPGHYHGYYEGEGA